MSQTDNEVQNFSDGLECHAVCWLKKMSLLLCVLAGVQAMQTAGIDGQQVVLLLEDHQFVDPQFLELTNSLLSAGEVPGLYTPEELEPLLAPIKDQASDAGFRGTIAQYFASRSYITHIFFLCLL